MDSENMMPESSPVITTDVLDLVDRYNHLRDLKEQLEDNLKQTNKAIEETRDALAAAMVEAEIDGLNRHGYRWTLQTKTQYSKKAGDDETFFEVLRENGLGDIIKETVNAQTLQGAMSELAEQNDDELPDEFADVINVYQYMDIGRRKETTSKTRKKKG